MSGRLPVLVISVVLAAASCELLGPACATILQPGIRVTVLDSISGEPLAGNEVTVVASDGAYADTAMGFPGGTFVGLHERSGTYRVEVTAPGYARWVREGVRVEMAGDCSPPPVEVVARMRPAVRAVELPAFREADYEDLAAASRCRTSEASRPRRILIGSAAPIVENLRTRRDHDAAHRTCFAHNAANLQPTGTGRIAGRMFTAPGEVNFPRRDRRADEWEVIRAWRGEPPGGLDGRIATGMFTSLGEVNFPNLDLRAYDLGRFPRPLARETAPA